jgi:apolipoprotein D and lipocalin family protein
MMHGNSIKIFTAACVAFLMSACSPVAPLKTVDYVDLPRFMGDWYVIANIPTSLEKGAHNAIESYRLDPDGTIATTFTFHADGFDGELKRYNPRGFIRDSRSNAEWGMRFVWPIKADYRIVYLDEDYSVTIIGRNKRDYVWLMARQPVLQDARYEELLDLIAAMGYDRDEVRRVPQRW